VIRKTASALAIFAVATLAAACGSAPDSSERSTSATSEALNNPNGCANAAVPFSTTSYQRVWNEGNEVNPRGSWGYEMVCTALTGAPVTPTTGPWAGVTPDQCTPYLTNVSPPSDLPLGCTAGVQLGTVNTLFLCPITDAGVPSNYQVITPNDSCVGPLLAPGWQFVEGFLPVARCTAKYCGYPGPLCGGNCAYF
jgi:hypothetical protein